MNVSTESVRMRLPRSVQEIADVIGCERALYLIGQLPRCITRDRRYPNATASHVVLYVPTAARLPLDHDLVRILGWSDAVKLCRVFGGEILQPASCAEIYRRYRDAEIIRMKSAGVRTQYIASVFGVSASILMRRLARAASRKRTRNLSGICARCVVCFQTAPPRSAFIRIGR
ncbi:hypothetical protein, partial [Burkholderia sp. TSV86]|uniref:hypothetical protein n=1 Tax=Burkholderia sp. TSV86 TaxID=1385594 RepID=UPI000A923FE6